MTDTLSLEQIQGEQVFNSMFHSFPGSNGFDEIADSTGFTPSLVPQYGYVHCAAQRHGHVPFHPS